MKDQSVTMKIGDDLKVDNNNKNLCNVFEIARVNSDKEFIKSLHSQDYFEKEHNRLNKDFETCANKIRDLLWKSKCLHYNAFTDTYVLDDRYSKRIRLRILCHKFAKTIIAYDKLYKEVKSEYYNISDRNFVIQFDKESALEKLNKIKRLFTNESNLLVSCDNLQIWTNKDINAHDMRIPLYVDTESGLRLCITSFRKIKRKKATVETDSSGHVVATCITCGNKYEFIFSLI